jgi:tetratricopeptide (TPR) repeat protein
MATQSPTKQRTTEENSKPAGFVPTADNLLAKDLRRNCAPADLSKRDDETLKPVRLDAPYDSPPAAPSAIRQMPTPRTASVPGPSEDKPSGTVSEVTQRPRSMVVAPATVAPKPEPMHQRSPQDPAPEDRPARTQPAVALLTGHSLRFPADVPLGLGKRIELDGRSFEIKPEESFRGLFWAKSFGVLALTVLAAIGVAYLVSGPTQSTITGVVVDAQSGRILPNATVSMADGRVARTNQAGIYQFEGIIPSQYILTASARGFESQNGFIEPEAGKSDQLSFALAPQFFAGLPSESDSANGAQAAEASEKKSKESASSSNRAVGTVTLTVDFEGYLVFVDGELYGKNSTEVKRLSAGTHTILLQLDGYQDHTSTVEVKARAKSKLKITKADLTPRLDPIKRSRGLFAEGKNYLDNQEWGAAIHLFDQALEHDPNYAEACQYRGWASLKAQKPTDATADFTRAAELYDQAKRYIDAVACAKYLIELDPKNPANWRRRADYNLALADYDAAVSDYEKAVKLDKKSLTSRMALGEALFAAGRYNDAAKEFDRARRLADDPSVPYIRMILAYYNAGDINDVEKKYKDFSEVAPPELMDRLRDDPEWLKVLQIVGPDERNKN